MIWIAAWLVTALALGLLLARLLRVAPFIGFEPRLRGVLVHVTRELAARAPEISVDGASEHGIGLRLLVGERVHELGVGDLLTACVDGTDVQELHRRVHARVAEARRALADLARPEPEAWAARVLPQIHARGWILDHSAEFGLTAWVREPLFEGLEICYVLREGDEERFVTRALLEAAGWSSSELAQRAVENLHARAGDAALLLAEDARSRDAGEEDQYAAERVLLALGLDDVPGLTELVFALPERGCFRVAQRGPGLGELMRDVREQHAAAAQPLSERLFRIEDHRLLAADVEEAAVPSDAGAGSARDADLLER